MIKRLFILIAILCVVNVSAQNQTSSPYSYFGIGLPTFNGTAANHAMGGLSIHADSIHYNLANPAALGALKLTTFAVGATQRMATIKDAQTSENVRNTSFDYIAIGIPAGKLNFGFGVVPNSSVGYQLESETDNSFSRFEGKGGLTKLFLSFGYRIADGLRVGVEGGYNFGNIDNTNVLFQDLVQYGTREHNRSDLNGFKFKVGAQYEFKISPKLMLKTSASYSPEAELTSKNTRDLATIAMSSSDGFLTVNQQTVDLGNTKFNLPSDFRIGAGVGEFQKWFAGIEYQHIGKTAYTNTSFTASNVQFKESTIYRLGGFYIPNYNDINSYFNRITFRGGLRYAETGLNINGEDIDEFGITFGLGLPAGQFLSNINLGVEYGQRGTTTAGLVQENYFKVFIGISLNDKWFIKRKYH